ECAKAEYNDPIYKDSELYTIKATGTRFFKHNLEEELLEYRRQHNIFESEDKIVVKNDCLIDFADSTLNLKVLTVLMVTDEGFIRAVESPGLFKSSLIRHATDAEIK